MLKPKRSAAPKSAGPKVEVEAPTVVRRSYTRAKKEELLDVPPILLEGDGPASSPASGPGRKIFPRRHAARAKFFRRRTPPKVTARKNCFSHARDPHWLYAHWDLTREQQNLLNTESTDGHLILRIFTGKIEGSSRLRNPRPSRIAPLVRARRARGKFLHRRTRLLFRARQMAAHRRFQRHGHAARRRLEGRRGGVRHHPV